jgi:rare lipoprotein A
VGVVIRGWRDAGRAAVAVALLSVVAIAMLLAHARAETGLASWYSGGGTACGDRTVQPWTAAHKTLPCGAVVRVTTRSGSVTVTIRDRGPFIRGRIIDLDRVSAAQVGLIAPGVLPVTVERVR